ncbi:MAG: hypothetical protein ACYDAX_10440 [Desulfobacteria bacterium]
METRSGELQRIGFVLLAFALAFLACGAAYASDVERRIPVIRDTAGSGLTIDISREGTRQTATSFLTLNDPTVRRIEDRIAKMAAGLAAKVTPAEETVADAVPRIGLTGTPREGSGRTETTLSSLPPLPGEITIRNVKNFLKALRVSLKEKPAPTVAVAVPEQRLGMADTSQH